MFSSSTTLSASLASTSHYGRLVLLLTVLLIPNPTSITSFVLPNTNLVHHYRRCDDDIVSSEITPRQSLPVTITIVRPSFGIPSTTTSLQLAAKRGRPRASEIDNDSSSDDNNSGGSDDNDDDDDDSSFNNDEEDDEEEEEDEVDDEGWSMEMEDDEDEDDVGFDDEDDDELGEEEDDEEEEIDDYTRGKIDTTTTTVVATTKEGNDNGMIMEEEAFVSELKPVDDEMVDVWASYDAIYEEPPTPLLDDIPSDPNYKLAKDTILSQVAERKRLRNMDTKVPRSFTTVDSVQRTMDYIMNGLTDEERTELENDVDILEVERILSTNNNTLLTEDDIKDVLIDNNDNDDTDEDEGKVSIINSQAILDAGTYDDDRGPEAFPSSAVNTDGENLVYPKNTPFTEKDLAELDDQIRAYKVARERLDNQTYFGEEQVFAYLDIERDWPLLSNETQDEILNVIENSNTMASPEPEMWLMYDLKFNVTNLILAAFKHSGGAAPIIFTQWMPQLEVYAKYADQREKNFEWTWDDVENADITELERYYKGIGYDAIPMKEEEETGIITLDTSPMDDEEREMLALENWMDEVYNEESDNLLFDDENFEPRDNVYDPDYSPSKSSTDKSSVQVDKFLKEFETFEREFSEESQEWRDQFATVEKFEYRDDPEGQAAFRGHLVVACPDLDEDLQLAETITKRFKDEFDKAVMVETRVLGHARKEDYVFEVWLESYEIDLLHSKRQAFINSKLWTGPSDVDEKQLDYLVEMVRYLISDESRYSYRIDDSLPILPYLTK